MRAPHLIETCVVVFAVMVMPLAATAGVIPLPRQMTPLGGEFRPATSVGVEASDADARNVASFLDTFLSQHGIHPNVQGAPFDQAGIRLADNAADPTLGHDGYRLLIGSGGITISANGGAGLFYGVQTLEQLGVDDATGRLAFPGMRIVDWPTYAWRGIHLDVSRHFFPVPVVEQYIDLAARYKLNTFHWHLTDDQGWRIEIKKYPRLTSVGGCRNGSQVGGEGSTATDGLRYCGYYTQAQIREVVAYARARYITVVPEIEGPGHSVAAVSAYPWLGCDGKQYDVRELWGVSTQIMCPTERTFGFIDDVFREVASMFPGPYIHIGGDEVPHDAWAASPAVALLMHAQHLPDYDAVQGYFTRRVQAIAAKYHRRIIGWDEILDGGVSQSAIVMAWQDVSRGVLGVQRGNDVVMAPDGLVYFDAAQGDQRYEPLSIGGYLSAEMVYDFDPMPAGLTPQQTRHIIGVQGEVWAEYIPTASHLMYMLLPRELALAELCWTPRPQMNWYDFESRLGPELARLDSTGIGFRIPEVVFDLSGSGLELPEQRLSENEVDVDIGAGATVVLRETLPTAMIHYTIDGSVPTASSPTYAMPLTLSPGETVSAVATLSGGRSSSPSFLRVFARPADGR